MDDKKQYRITDSGAYLSESVSKKQQKKNKRKERFSEKLAMYDMIIANLIAGESIIEPDKHLDNSQIQIGFSNIASETQISKYFLIKTLPDYLQPRLIDNIRNFCILNGVKINFYFYSEPYKINWDSQEMKNRMSVWRDYAKETVKDVDIFDYRTKRKDQLLGRRILLSTKYLNEAELDYKRTLMKTAIMIEIAASREDESILNMMRSINNFKTFCSRYDIKVRELRVNMIDWLQTLGIFSLKKSKEVISKISYKILTDDILANFNSYKQGRVGTKGVCLGMDIRSGAPVLRKFKEDPDKAENWLVCAGSGGGKSYYVKTLITYLLADNFVVTVMDYEGDEYLNLAHFIADGNPEDVKIISMGKGSTIYFDPCEIPDLTGDPDIDDELKETAIGYIMSIFRIITCGLEGELTQWEERVISLAIQRMYDSAGVTEDKRTWRRSKGLRLEMVYEEIASMVESKELIDVDNDNVKHKAAIKIAEAASVYFNEGEAKYGTFKNPMSANELYRANFILFSFGMKGAAQNLNDPVVLALKQLSVSCVSSQISNNCKYIRHCFNVKVWEEFQRWGEAKGSADIISNAMTGGRKRGDVNFVLTNDLAAIIDDGNPITKRIRQNIQNMAIGKIVDRSVRSKFCEMFDLKDCEVALDRIAKTNHSNTSTQSMYKNAFCIALDSGEKAIVKVMLPASIKKSTLFRAGVDVKNQ